MSVRTDEDAEADAYMLMEMMAAKPRAAAPHASACNIQGRIVIVASHRMGRCGAARVRCLR
ncbi:hypothetical protein XH79_23835 [Bradyrhizobium sp. CCBAU 45389]|nr:hypothetical protein [Bradyrhizobium sp. CCBAU 45389]